MRTGYLLFSLFLAAPFASAEYADINGVRMYYEIHGEGRPTVLLHGGANSIAGSFAKQIPEFARTRRVIAPEQRGHGHTADTNTPLSYAQMAEDTAALLRTLGVRNADVVGWSDGGNVALVLALRHPDLVRRVVASGSNVHPDGSTRESVEWVRSITPEAWTGASRDYHAKVAPGGAAQWPILVAKVKKLWLETPTPDELSLELLKRLQQPTLLITGDRDTTNAEHTLAMYRALPNGRLFIVPGTGHDTFNRRADWVNAVVLSFLDAELKPSAK